MSAPRTPAGITDEATPDPGGRPEALADRPDAEVEVDVLVAGHVRMPHGYVFRAPDGGALARLVGGLRVGPDAVDAPFLSFAIRHPTAGTVLVDTGLHPDAQRSPRAEFGPALGLLLHGLRPAERSFDVQLHEIGVDPATVRCVVMTHLHMDHTSGMRLLPEAEFVCGAGEWRATRGRFAVGKGYLARHLPPASRMRLLDVAGDGERHGPFDRTVDLLGDGSVRLISTPGHTPGHLSVLLRATGGRRVLLAGDAAYTLRSIDDGVLPLSAHDDAASRRSLAQLAAFRAWDPAAIVVPTHDPAAWHAVRDMG